MAFSVKAIRAAGMIIITIAVSGMALSTPAFANHTKAQGKAAAYNAEKHSMYLRGLAFYGGSDNSTDYGMAAMLWQKAADMNDTDAQSGLGYLYYMGMGVTQSYEKAAKWYRRAAEAGAADAQYSLGVMYSKGEGVAKDAVQAMAWFITAIANGNNDAAPELKYMKANATPRQISQAWTVAQNMHGTDRSAAREILVSSAR